MNSRSPVSREKREQRGQGATLTKPCLTTSSRCTHPPPEQKNLTGKCAENWIATNPTEALLGRFASDVQPKRRRDDDRRRLSDVVYRALLRDAQTITEQADLTQAA